MRMKKTIIITSVLLAVFTLSGFALSALAAESANNSAVSATGKDSTLNDIQNRLQQMRANLKDFQDKKIQEAADGTAVLKEKIASKKKAIEARVAEAKKIKEEKQKTVLLNLIDIQIKQFTNAKERAAKMPNITDDLKVQLNTKTDAAISDLNAEKTKVQAAATPEQLKALAKEIKDLFKAKQDIVKRIVNAIMFSRINKSVAAAESRMTEIKNKIAELKASGKDVLSLETLFASAEAKFAAAKAAASKEDLKNAVDGLKEVYKELQNAVVEINGAPIPTPALMDSPAATFAPTSASTSPIVTPIATPTATPQL